MAKGKYQEWITEEGLIKLEGWARDGLTDEQIADNIGIQRTTLYDWKNKYSDISDSLKRGKEVIDRHVENALLKRALGYTYEEKTFETEKIIKEDLIDGKLLKSIDFKEVMTKRVIKEVQPDVTAQIFWLKNRKPKEWRDKRETELTGKDGEALNVVFNIPRPEKE